jgi:acetoin utilization protein AcuB
MIVEWLPLLVDGFLYMIEPIRSGRLIPLNRAMNISKEEQQMKQELVQDWMTRDVVTIAPETSLKEAHDIMRKKNIRRLPVVTHGEVLGIVTLGDIRGAEPSQASSLSIWEMNDLLAKLKVSEIMTRKPSTIQQTASIGNAAQTMLDKKISGLPVVDEKNRLVGIITESDIFRLVVTEWSGAAEN